VQDVVAQQENKEHLLDVFPNPSSTGKVNVMVSNLSAENVILQVSTATGQQVFTNHYRLNAGNNQLNLDLSNLSPGMYFVIAVTNTGRSVQKLVIE